MDSEADQNLPNGSGELRKRKYDSEAEEDSKSIVVDEDVEGLKVPRTIGLAGGVSFIVGTIIGSGIFISPRGVALYSGSVGMTLLVWLICGIVSLLGAFCYSELGIVIRSSGGDYTYLHEAYGSLVSFQFSWINNFLTKPGSQATLALTFAEYIVTPFFNDECGSPPELIKRFLAAALLLFLGAVNVFSVKMASKMQIVFTIAKLIPVAIIVVGGIVMLSQGYTENLETGFEGTSKEIGLIMTSFYSGMWAYDGWNTANFMVEEMIRVERNLPLSIIIGVPSVIVIYVMMNVSYFTVLSVDDMVKSHAVALTWANIVIPKASWIIPTFVALSCFGACNGSLFSGGRLINAAARNNHLPGIFSMVHINKFTPVAAIMSNVTLAIIITFIGSISSLIDLLSFSMWIFYCLNFASVIIFRRMDKYKNVYRRIKVPLILPIVCFLFSACLVIIPLVVSPQLGYFFALGIIILGYIVYVPLVHFKLKPACMGPLTSFLQLFLQVFIPVRENI